MSFDLMINQHSRLGHFCALTLMVFCFLLTLTVSLPLLVKVIVLALFFIIYVSWKLKQQDQITLTFDGKSWYIHTRKAVYTAARIHSVRSYVWCFVFEFRDDDGDYFRQVVWQDQIPTDAWRRLAVFSTLYSYR